jgi:hypothetical protein
VKQAVLAICLVALVLPGFAQSAIGNFSIRGQVSPDDHFISGFFVAGIGSGPVLIRGVGPALTQFGVTNALKKPVLTLYNARGEVIAQNAGWGTRPADEVTKIRSGSGAFLLAQDSDDSGMYITLEPGAYTAEVSGAGGSSGIALIEMYQGNPFGGSRDQAHFVNASNRCTVGVGQAVGIAGVALPLGRRLLIRAIGPSLAQFGVAGVLADPKLEIVRPEMMPVRGSIIPPAIVARNDDWNTPMPLGPNQDGVAQQGVSWQGSPDEVREATARCGAFRLDERTKDAAMLVQVSYFTMMIQVSGANGSSGVALIEIYDVDR